MSFIVRIIRYIERYLRYYQYDVYVRVKPEWDRIKND